MDYELDLTSCITTKTRSVDVDPIAHDATPLGVHSKYQTSLSIRHVEIEATQSPLVLRLTPMQDTMLELEFEGMQPTVKNGKVAKFGLYGAALWLTIVDDMTENYPTITFMTVRDTLTSPYITVIRPLWVEQYLAKKEKRKAG